MLLIECSFVGADDRDRARKYAHIHLGDIAERLRFSERSDRPHAFSLRYRPAEITEALDRLRRRSRTA